MWRKGNPHILLVGMQTGTATMEDSMEISQKIKIELPYDPAIPLLSIYPKGMNNVFLHLLQHYSQYPRYGNNLSVHRQKNG